MLTATIVDQDGNSVIKVDVDTEDEIARYVRMTYPNGYSYYYEEKP
jgi:hypothetical protein